MSEWGVNGTGKPSEIESGKAFWAQDQTTKADAAVNVAEPSTSRKESGWQLNEPAVSAWQNWMMALVFRILDWLSTRYVRAFTDLYSARVVDTGHTFQLTNDAPDPLFSRDDSASVGTIALLACTGDVLTVIEGTTIHALDPEDPTTTLFEEEEPNTTDAALSMFSDGRHLYLGYTDGSAARDDIFVLDLTDFSIYLAGLESLLGDVVDIVGNGVNFATLAGNQVNVYEIELLAIIGVEPHGGTANAIAIDHDRVYMGGQAGTGSDELRAMDIATVTLQDSFTLPATSGSPEVNDIVVDGEFVYIVTTDATDSGGGNYNVMCLTRYLVEVWRTFAGGDPAAAAVDDRYLYIADGNNSFYAIDKRSGAVVFADETGDIATSKVDADGVYAYAITTSGELVRYSRGPSRATVWKRQDVESRDRLLYKAAAPVT